MIPRCSGTCSRGLCSSSWSTRREFATQRRLTARRASRKIHRTPGEVNGALDDDEVTVRTPVCNQALVLRIQAEPTGANCAHGGTAVQSGLDGNGNGVLDDAEVAHTDYLCRGALATRVEAAGAR
jgi:hypothetical protein